MAGRGRVILIVAGAFIIGQIIGCTSTPISVRYENLVQQGIDEIGQGRYEDALETLDSAIQLDDSSPDAHALKGIAILMNMVIKLQNMIQQLVDLITQFGGSFGISFQQGGFLMTIVSSVLWDNVFSYLTQAADEFDLVEQASDFRREIPSIPVKIEDPIVGLFSLHLDFGGEWDLGDIYFIDSAITMFTSFYWLIVSTDLTMYRLLSLSTLFNYPSLKKISDEPIFAISNILATVLNVEPQLLKVNSEGTDYVNKAKALLLEAVTDEKKFIDYTKQETYQDGQFITAHPDKQDYFVLTFKEIEMGSPVTNQVEFEINSRIPGALEAIEADLSGEPNARTSWAVHLAPLISVSLVAFLRSGLLSDILQSVCYSAVSSDQRGLCDQLLSPTFITEDFLQALLTALIPPIFEVDLDALFNYLSQPNSPGIRGFLPAWTAYEKDYSSYPPSSSDTIIMEWDCGVNLHHYEPGITDTSPFKDNLDSSLWYLACKSSTLKDNQGNPIPDISHFSQIGKSVKVTGELQYPDSASIPPDNIVSPFPYFLFNDPTLGGTLYVNLQGVWPGATTNPCDGSQLTSDFVQPDNNCELNATLAAVAGSIIEAISSLTGGGSSGQ